MNTLKLVAFLSILASCTERGENDTKAIPDNASNFKGEARLDSTIKVDNSKLTAMQFADGIISGQIHPSDNDQTFAWLDSLQSNSKPTRDIAFNVYKAMCLKSDGALSEAICGHIKSFFEGYPSEFLDNYILLDEKQKVKTTENIAFEFHASGTEYKDDIAIYFTSILKKCKACFNNPNLHEIRSTVEQQVSKLDD